MRNNWISTTLRATFSVVMLASSCADASGVPARVVLSAGEFGVVADGRTDDGAAIQRMIDRARNLDKAAELRFPSNRVICVRSGVERYAFLLRDIKELRINGQGSEFRLASDIRFLRAKCCPDLEVGSLKVDFLTQPTTPGTITEVDSRARAITVTLDHPEMAAQLGGPTKEDGEQGFFGMVLLDALYDTKKVVHYYADRVDVKSPGVVRVFNEEPGWGTLAKHVKPGRARVDLPVPGIAHRFGPGALFAIDDCKNVTVSHVDVWSAPWFTFHLFRNEGQVTFRRVNVMPKPGSRKVLSSCRDAIHAKGNRAAMLFEDCVLAGLGDDAFNISTHCSRVRAIESPTRITVSQQFPLGHIPFRVGDTLILMDPGTNCKVAERKIINVDEIPSSNPNPRPKENPWAPSSVLTLDSPVSDVARKGLVAWSRESSNPMTIIRRCVIRRSCRLQTPVVMEACDVQAFLWFYGDSMEGPGPESLAVRKSRLWTDGLAHPSGALTVSGFEKSRRESVPVRSDAVLQRVELIGNEIKGIVRIANALEVEATGNHITTPDTAPIRFEHCGRIKQE